MFYLGLKAVHVAAVLLFVGGLFVQSFAVVAASQTGSGTAQSVYRWDQRVTLPAMLIVWASGAWVAAAGAWFSDHWLWAKLAFVIALSGLHGVQSGRLRRLRGGKPSSPEAGPLLIPAIVAASVTIIAILAVAKPF